MVRSETGRQNYQHAKDRHAAEDANVRRTISLATGVLPVKTEIEVNATAEARPQGIL